MYIYIYIYIIYIYIYIYVSRLVDLTIPVSSSSSEAALGLAPHRPGAELGVRCGAALSRRARRERVEARRVRGDAGEALAVERPPSATAELRCALAAK